MPNSFPASALIFCLTALNLSVHLCYNSIYYYAAMGKIQTTGGFMEILRNSVAGTLESSDIMINLEPLEQGKNGVEIELQSIVEKQFGREIRRAIAETLAELGVDKVKVNAVDKGALDCTIRARTKTAVYRAGGNCGGDPAYEWKN
jgi:citrate lyase subunit gamma (acyl carrier protein)